MDSEETTSQTSTITSPTTCTSQRLRPVPYSRPKRASSQPAGSATISLFSLPREIRDKIYKKVLIIAHPVFLFQDTGSRVETFAPDRPHQWLSLLYTNRQMRSEATPVLYGMNNFSLVDTTRQQTGLLQAFVDCIGSVNAESLSYLCINLPVAERIEDQPGKIKLRDDSLRSLKILQENCTNLTTLDFLIHNKNSKALVQTDLVDLQFIRDALSQIDAQLKAILSLNRIIVRVRNAIPIPTSVIESMQGLGWVVLRGHGI